LPRSRAAPTRARQGAYKFDCRDKTYANYAGPQHLVCPTWERGYVGTLMALSDAIYFEEHSSEVYGVMTVGEESYSGSIIVINIALHDNLDARFVVEHAYGPAIARARHSFPRARVVCMLLSAPDEALKPAEFVEAQGHRAVDEFNAKMRAFCEGQGADVFEAWAPTVNASTYDGTHFAGATNALLAQLFLNTLAQGKGWDDASRVLGLDYLM
jgi:hypothetical protein